MQLHVHMYHTALDVEEELPILLCKRMFNCTVSSFDVQ